ncbi:COQ9 family protein [Brevirhabdus sp.]|uniref:COQ9 family protein n=1 Tax=Brevirhabdus sp. TaxID=2004514 RepID=UPI00405A2E02
MTPTNDKITDALLDAALPHVPFDGWSETTWRAALRDAGVDADLARAMLPRRALDLALAFHRRGDAQMVARLATEDLSTMRFRDRIAHAIRLRLELVAPHKEAVRRGATLFALPHHSADGARALWSTVDAIWIALGDSSQDYNWYTKRVSLSAIYAATLLFWLGDDSADYHDTWDFLDRRIDNAMQVEKTKAMIGDNAALRPLLAVPQWLLGRVRAPSRDRFHEMPGAMTPGTAGPDTNTKAQ